MRASAGPALRISSRANARAFEAWARSYDHDANPLVALEHRYVERLLPEISGRDVLDAGCGSGRWLRHLAAMHPRALHGVDTSPSMLKVARQKGIGATGLHRCSCDAVPFSEASFDLVLASFVLSYVPDLEAVGAEFTRIARVDCDLILSDVHPETQQRLEWRRSFRKGGSEICLEGILRSPGKIVDAFTRRGWTLVSALEPEFGAPERELFESAGRLHHFTEAVGLPAVCILHLRKTNVLRSGVPENSPFVFRGAHCAFGPEERAAASIQIAEDEVKRVASPRFLDSVSAGSQEIDLTGCLIMPGLVNAHDHLEFGLFPRLGRKTYVNMAEWAGDIHAHFAEVIATHKRVPLKTRLWWGGVRNLLCGATTVCHHNPPHPELLRSDFPVRVVRDYGWAHSLAFDEGIRAAHAASPPGRPFVVHGCEGIDESARREIAELDRLGVLDAHTVIVHGLALNGESTAIMRLRGASVVICPSSNFFLFGRAPDMQVIGSTAVAIGSDSPLTARGDLLDEARFAMECCEISPAQAWRMITESPARALRLPPFTGSLRAGSTADLIAIRDTESHAAERLRSMTAADIELVMVGGRVHLASAAMLQRFPARMKTGLEPLWVDGRVRWLRAPVQHLLAQAEAILGRRQVRLGNKPVRAASAGEAQHGNR